MSVGMRIKAARQIHGWSQAGLARQSGLSQRVVEGYETDKVDMPTKRVKLLCSVLGVTPNWLLEMDEGDGDVLEAIGKLTELEQMANRLLMLIEGERKTLKAELAALEEGA